MKSRVILGLVSLSLGAVACSAQRAPQAEPAASRATAEAPAGEKDDGAADEKATESAPVAPAAAPMKKEGLAPSESSADAAGAAAPKQAAPDELSQEVRAFDDSIQPTQLSCSGARPHRDAICSIAERLCELPAERPSTTRPSARCDEARHSCEQARSRFKERCGT